MAKRTAISKKTRFEVFKRDSFSCQYCGISAPNVILHIDHINPVSAGGTNEILNLITSCIDCNLGKSDRKLDDKSIPKKQFDQIKAISIRQEQLAMMAEWRNGMLSIEDKSVESIIGHLNLILKEHGYKIADTYNGEVRAMIKKYSIDDVYLAIDKAVAGYLRKIDDDSIIKFLKYIPRICYWQKLEKDDPKIAEINKLVGMANKRWFRCNRSDLHRRIITLHEKDHISLDTIKNIVVGSTGIMQFEETVGELLNG